MAVLTDAINAILNLLDNCTLADKADFVQHTFYKIVRFVPEYPLGSLDVPTVALSTAGGFNRSLGLGQRTRWHEPRLQLDVLASTPLDARRIYEKVWEILLYDMQGGAKGTEGTYGTRYLYGKGIKELELDEANAAVWDEEGRVSRLIADLRVTYKD